MLINSFEEPVLCRNGFYVSELSLLRRQGKSKRSATNINGLLKVCAMVTYLQLPLTIRRIESPSLALALPHANITSEGARSTSIQFW